MEGKNEGVLGVHEQSDIQYSHHIKFTHSLTRLHEAGIFCFVVQAYLIKKEKILKTNTCLAVLTEFSSYPLSRYT